MSNNIVQFNEEIIKGQIKELVRESVEETLNSLLEAEADKLTQAAAGFELTARRKWCMMLMRSQRKEGGIPNAAKQGFC